MQSNGSLRQTTICTIGHSNVEFEKFLSLLKETEVLVDVRSVPYSKYVPQFNADNLKRGLESIGIRYVFMEDEYAKNILGGRPSDNDCYTNGKVIYEEVVKKKWYKEGILALIDLADKNKVTIMCSEEDPYKCHRHQLITQSLLKKGVIVFHIRGNSNKERIDKPEKKLVQLTLI
ncbi:MAG: DUF488 domain-containing protein [ANME-2 cluster archaeon]|nr:MAG: DUF488 domain-containing protein [ANME-2 cluster archaeon]